MRDTGGKWGKAAISEKCMKKCTEYEQTPLRGEKKDFSPNKIAKDNFYKI